MRRILDRYLSRRTLERWSRAARRAETAALPELRRQRDQARNLRTRLDRLIQIADRRLALPRIGSWQFPKPLGTDWSWRPELWRGPLPRPGLAAIPRKAPMDDRVTIFHDCPMAEIGLLQVRNSDEKDLAPYGLVIETFEFAGTFLSVSVELPSEAVSDFTGHHQLRVSVLADCERPTGLFARLNIQHGPNTEQVLRDISPDQAPATADFDLSNLNLNVRRIEKIWLDLILQEPRLNRVVLRDLTMCRYHRADL